MSFFCHKRATLTVSTVMRHNMYTYPISGMCATMWTTVDAVYCCRLNALDELSQNKLHLPFMP